MVSRQSTVTSEQSRLAAGSVPDTSGHFDRFGGRFVPEALYAALLQLEQEFHAAMADPDFTAELNDLLQLDHDAVEAYTIAIDRIRDAGRRESLVSFRADHKRHIEELAALVRARGGLPTELPHPTGALKLAVQALGSLGDDTSLLLAFKAVEGQVRDKYQRAARRTG